MQMAYKLQACVSVWHPSHFVIHADFVRHALNITTVFKGIIATWDEPSLQAMVDYPVLSASTSSLYAQAPAGTHSASTYIRNLCYPSHPPAPSSPSPHTLHTGYVDIVRCTPLQAADMSWHSPACIYVHTNTNKNAFAMSIPHQAVVMHEAL